MRDLASAKAVADPDLIWEQRDDGVKRCRSLPEIVGTVERRAHDRSIPLTPHDRSAERVDAIMDNFRRDGQLKAFNRCYKAHRLRANGHARERDAFEDTYAAAKAIAECFSRNELQPHVLGRAY